MRLKGISFLFLVISSSLAGNTWSATLETGDDLFYGLRDGIVLSSGSTVISIAGPFENPFLICLDEEGEILWYRHILEFGGTSRAFESNGSLVALENGFAACFHSEPRATGIDTDVAVVRLDSSGEILWTYILGETDEAVWMSTDIIACSDGGVLVTGCPGMQLPGGFAFKLSSDGRQEWLTQPEAIAGFTSSAVETDSGDFLILVVDEYSNRTVLQQVSSDGQVSSSPRAIAETTIQFKMKYINGSLWVYSPADGNTVQAFRLDEDFNPVQTIKIHLPQEYEARSADILENGFLVSGGTEDGIALIAMYGFDGSLNWKKQYDTGGMDFLYSATYLDEGILAFGRAQQFLDDFSVFLLMKVDHSGYVDGASVNENGTLLIESEALCVDLLSPGWLAACSVVMNENDAVICSDEIMEQTGLQTGYLWIPDWQSLSGSNGWLVYAISCMETEGSLEDGFAALLELYPDTYFIWVSQGWERNVMSVEEFLSR